MLMSHLVETAFKIFNGRDQTQEKGSTENETTGHSAGSCLNTGESWTKLRTPTRDSAKGTTSGAEK